MQGKGIIKFFLIALGIVSLIQFAFLIPTKSVENKADRYAQNACGGSDENVGCYKISRAKYLDSVSSVPVFSIPLIKTYTYQDLKAAQLNFGLDLKGGMSVLLQVDLRDFIRAMADNSTDPALEKALTLAAERQKTSQADFISLFNDAWKEAAPDRQLNSLFKRNESLKDQINGSTSDAEVINVLRTQADGTFDRTYELLKQRIDKLGVVGPNVSPDKSRQLILVELPGVDNAQRARTYLQAAAKLEFWNVYRISDSGLLTSFQKANERLKKNKSGELTETKPAVPDTTATVQTDTSKTDTSIAKTNPADTSGKVAQTTTSDTSKSATAQADTSKLDTSTTALNQGPLFDVFSLNTTGQWGLAAMGTAEKNKRQAVLDMLNRPGIKELFPRDIMFLWSRNPETDPNNKNDLGNTYVLYAIKQEPGKQTAPLEGDRVIESYASPDPNTGELSITLSMDQEGARTWGNMTEKAAADQNRQIAIVLDSTVVSAPAVQNPIRDGRSSITGSFTVQEAQDLANILEIGKLPARTQILQESLVGPSLGAENIKTSFRALVIGFLMVLAFMVIYFGGGGVVAIISLLLNFVFMLGAMASLGTVLTLPGVAGIVLTVGMAVDANIIVFERVKEELRAGKTLTQALKLGYQNSMSAIIDGNMTNFLTAVVLATFGLGAIKGFAVVLIIGLISTMFTAVAVSRLITEWWVGSGRKFSVAQEATKNVLANLNVDWMKYRKRFYVVSLGILALGLMSALTRGFDYGVDFKGGYSINVEFKDAPDVDAIRSNLTTSFGGNAPIVKSVDTENTYNIVTDYLVNDPSEDAPNQVVAKLYEGLGAMTGGATLETFKDVNATGTHITSFTKVVSNVADDIRSSAWKAVIFGILAIFLYILIRFSKWQYSLGAIVAPTFTALTVVSLFSFLHGILPFSMEIDQAFIAAILTIIGYSVNDTVVVYDRIRENFGLHPDMPKNEVINMSINSTMSRTMVTGLSTIFTVTVLLIFGSDSLKGFAFAMLAGIIVGTYASVFVAAPVMSDLSKKDEDIRITKKPLKEEKKKSFTHH